MHPDNTSIAAVAAADILLISFSSWTLGIKQWRLKAKNWNHKEMNNQNEDTKSGVDNLKMRSIKILLQEECTRETNDQY